MNVTYLKCTPSRLVTYSNYMISIMTKTSVEQLVNVGAQIELFQKISNTGGRGGRALRIYFFETSLEFFILLLYTWKFQTKKAQPLNIPQNCVRSLGNSKAKNKDP